jgi:hypothetical protein
MVGKREAIRLVPVLPVIHPVETLRRDGAIKTCDGIIKGGRIP